MNKIIDDRLDNKICYGDLKTGETFICEQQLYIKTNILEEDCDNDFYAINLADGTKYPIGNKVPVIPAEISIHIIRDYKR